MFVVNLGIGTVVVRVALIAIQTSNSHSDV